MTETARPPHYIRAWRERRGLSLRKLAARMESEPGGDPIISHASLARIETGDQPFSEPILNALAVALDVPRSWLLDRDPNKDGAVIDMMARLNDRDRERVMQMIELMVKTG